jgi:hemoglobin
MNPVSIYDYAGGAPVFQRLTEAFYAKVVRDPLVSPLFEHFTDDHIRNVAIWLGEVFGGPALYSEQHGGHRGVLTKHGGLGITEAQRERWAALMIEAAGEVLPSEPRLRRRFADYIQWGTEIAQAASQPGFVVGHAGEVPRWEWGPDGPPSGVPSS